MKKSFGQLILSLAIVGLAIVLGAGTASATWVTSAVTSKSVLPNVASANLTAVAATDVVTYTLGAGESLTANDTITIALTGGAKFAAVPTLTPSAGDVGGGVTSAATPLSGGTVGSTSATWRVIAAVGGRNTLTLNSTTSLFNVSALTSSADITINLLTSTSVQIGTANLSLKSVLTNYPFTLATAAETIALTAASDEADVAAVAGAYFKFAAASVTGTATVLSFTNDSGAATLPTTVNVSIGKMLITLAGDFTGIDYITGTGITGSDSTGDITSGTAGRFLINSAKTYAYAVNTAAIAGGATLAVAPRFYLTGAVAQGARSFTAKVDVLLDGAAWTAHTAKVATTIYSISRNGWQGTIPYIYASTDPTADTFIKLANNGSINSTVTMSVTNDAGTITNVTVTPTNSISNGTGVNAKSVGQFSASNIATLAGVTMPGAMSVTITVNATNDNITAVCIQKRTGGTDRIIPVYMGSTASAYKQY